MGLTLISTSLFTDPSKLVLSTFINGEVRQVGELNDLAFSVERLIEIEHMLTGTTLQKGSVIMTGAPGVSLRSFLYVSESPFH